MIRVEVKIKEKDKLSRESLESIEKVVRDRTYSIPVKIGDYYVFGMVPIEFE